MNVITAERNTGGQTEVLGGVIDQEEYRLSLRENSPNSPAFVDTVEVDYLQGPVSYNITVGETFVKRPLPETPGQDFNRYLNVVSLGERLGVGSTRVAYAVQVEGSIPDYLKEVELLVCAYYRFKYRNAQSAGETAIYTVEQGAILDQMGREGIAPRYAGFVLQRAPTGDNYFAAVLEKVGDYDSYDSSFWFSESGAPELSVEELNALYLKLIDVYTKADAIASTNGYVIGDNSMRFSVYPSNSGNKGIDAKIIDVGLVSNAYREGLGFDPEDSAYRTIPKVLREFIKRSKQN